MLTLIGIFLGQISQYNPNLVDFTIKITHKLVSGKGFIRQKSFICQARGGLGSFFEIGDHLPVFGQELDKEKQFPDPDSKLVVKVSKDNQEIYADIWGYKEDFQKIAHLMRKLPLYKLIVTVNNQKSRVISRDKEYLKEELEQLCQFGSNPNPILYRQNNKKWVTCDLTEIF